MPSLVIEVTHSLGREETLRRMKEKSGEVIRAFQSQVSDLHYEWNDNVLSFGFKYGIPLDADLMIDVRFIPNPYFIPELKPLDGRDDRVWKYVKRWPETQGFLERYFSLLEHLVPLYEKEGKSYLTIAVGCTGGQHRSVTIAQEIFRHLASLKRDVVLSHRDIDMAEDRD